MAPDRGPSPVNGHDPWSCALARRNREAHVVLAVALSAWLGTGLRLLRGEAQTGPALLLGGVALLAAASLRRWPPGDVRRKVLTSVLALAVLAALSPHFGRGSSVLFVAGVLVADLALGGWWSARSDRRYARPVLQPLVGLVVLVGVCAAAGAVAWGAALVLLCIALLAMAGSWPSRFDRISGRVASGVEVVAAGVGVVVTAVFAFPLLYLPARLHRTGSRRSGDVEGGLGWVRRPPGLQGSGSEVRHMFLPVPDAVRQRRVRGSVAALGVCALVVVAAGDVRTAELVEVSTAAADAGGSATPPPAQSNRGEIVPYSERPAYLGQAWADDLQFEQNLLLGRNLVFDPVSSFVTGDFAGAYTNTAGGVRRSLEPAECDCRELTVWLFGGSAAFGVGQRDGATIASELVELGRAQGISLDVVNHAVPGWTSDQEVAAAMDRAQDADPVPDMFLFYSGYNDAFLAAAVAGISGGLPDELARPDPADLESFRSGLEGHPGRFSELVADAGGPGVVGTAAADHYLASLEVAQRSLPAPVLFVLQADALVSPVHREDGLLAEPALRDPADADAWGRVLDSMEEAVAGTAVLDLRRVATTGTEPVFLDSVHTNELGASIVARGLQQEAGVHFDRLARPAGGSHGSGG